MKKQVALEIIKAEKKKAEIDTFIDKLHLEDVPFRELLRQYLYPYTPPAFLTGSKDTKELERQLQQHYSSLRLPLVAYLTKEPLEITHCGSSFVTTTENDDMTHLKTFPIVMTSFRKK